MSEAPQVLKYMLDKLERKSSRLYQAWRILQQALYEEREL